MVSDLVPQFNNAVKFSLNPCFSGRWSLICGRCVGKRVVSSVLILVLVEDGLWWQRQNRLRSYLRVLILVLVEDGLWQLLAVLSWLLICLNPCFSGRWSLTFVTSCKRVQSTEVLTVLILVLVEDGLWPKPKVHWLNHSCLNPCFSGRWSLTLCRIIRVQHFRFVLILVLVEDGLWHQAKYYPVLSTS